MCVDASDAHLLVIAFLDLQINRLAVVARVWPPIPIWRCRRNREAARATGRVADRELKPIDLRRGRHLLSYFCVQFEPRRLAGFVSCDFVDVRALLHANPTPSLISDDLRHRVGMLDKRLMLNL